MAFDSTRVEKPMARMVALMQCMPEVKFLLWCSRYDIMTSVCQYLTKAGVTPSVHVYDDVVLEETKNCIVVYEPFSNAKPWIRDAFITANLSGRNCWMIDTVDETASDQGWAKRFEQITLASGVKLKIVGNADDQAQNMSIAGGDVLMDGKWVFLGKKAPLLEHHIETQLNPGAKIIVLDEKASHKELYHLDLFMTLTGNMELGRYVIMLGSFLAMEPEFEEKAAHNNSCLDKIAMRLEKDYELKVVRTPIPVAEHVYSYNNCIVELTQNRKNVWLPAYSFDGARKEALQGYEQEIKTIWQNQGFNPCLVHATYGDLLGLKAGLHCITNEIRS